MTGPVILEEVHDHDQKFSDSDIIDYAKWLGIDPDKEPQLLYLARDGIQSELPPFWKPCLDENGDIYYFNFSTGQSIWEHPCDLIYKELVHTERARLNQSKLLYTRSDNYSATELNQIKPELCIECNTDSMDEANLKNSPKSKSDKFEQEDYVRKFASRSSIAFNAHSKVGDTTRRKNSQLNFEAKLFSNYPKHSHSSAGIRPKLSLAGPRTHTSRSLSCKVRRKETLKRAQGSSSSEMVEQPMKLKTQGSNVSLNLVSNVDRNLLNGSGSTDLTTSTRDDPGAFLNDRVCNYERVPNLGVDDHFEEPVRLTGGQQEYGIPLVRLNERYPETCTRDKVQKPTLIYNPNHDKGQKFEHKSIITDHDQVPIINTDVRKQTNGMEVAPRRHTPETDDSQYIGMKTKVPTENIRITALHNYLDSVKSSCFKPLPTQHLSHIRDNFIWKYELPVGSSFYNNAPNRYRQTMRPIVVDLRRRTQIRPKSWSPTRYVQKLDEEQENHSLNRNLSCPHIISPNLYSGDQQTHNGKSNIDRFILESIAKRVASSTYRPSIVPTKAYQNGPIRLYQEKDYLTNKPIDWTNQDITSRSFKKIPDSNFWNQSDKKSINPAFKHTIDWDRLSVKLGELRNSAFERTHSERTNSFRFTSANENPELMGYLEWLDSARSKLRQLDMVN